MSKAAKMIVGTVVAIAAPYFAPAMFAAIAPTVAAAGGLGATAGAAAIGAAGGALGAGIQGGDVGLGAGLGLLGGGLQGWNAARAADASKLMGTMSATGADKVIGAAAAPATAGGIETGLGSYAAAPSYLDAGVQSGAAIHPEFARAFDAVNPGLVGTEAATTAGLMPQVANLGAGLSYTPGAATAADTGYWARTKDAVGDAWNSAMTPENLVRTGGRLATYLGSSALAGSGMTSAEEALMRQQRADLRRVEEANKRADEIRTEQALNLINKAPYWDPNQIGLQYAREEQARGNRAKQAGLRGLDTNARRAEARRYDIGISKNTGSAYDKGFGRGAEEQRSTITQGVGLLPNATQSAYAGLYEPYQNAYERQRDVRSDIGKLISDTTFNDEEEEDRNKRRGG